MNIVTTAMVCLAIQVGIPLSKQLNVQYITQSSRHLRAHYSYPKNSPWITRISRPASLRQQNPQ